MTNLVHLPLLCSIWTVIKYKTKVHISLLNSHSVSIFTLIKDNRDHNSRGDEHEDIDLDSRQSGDKQTVKCKIESADLDTLRDVNLNQK